jgi:hypothetical protein
MRWLLAIHSDYFGQQKTRRALRCAGFCTSSFPAGTVFGGLAESESISYVVDFKWIAYVFLGGGVAVGVAGD